MDVEWDPEKAQANLLKHGTPFEEAASAFDDPLFLVYADPDHSIDELRFLLLGMSNELRVLVASNTERGSAVRVISTREATRAERVSYEEDS